jgi:cytochrome bd-type quinol oxidase subunit 2
VPLADINSAPEPSLVFFSYAGFVALPIIGIYTIGAYWVFCGKIRQPKS